MASRDKEKRSPPYTDAAVEKINDDSRTKWPDPGRQMRVTTVDDANGEVRSESNVRAVRLRACECELVSWLVGRRESPSTDTER